MGESQTADMPGDGLRHAPGRPELAALQRYLDENDELHEALGLPCGLHLGLRPFAQGEYNVNFAFDAPAAPAGQVLPGSPRALLLRVNTSSQMHLPDQIAYEFRALAALAPTGRTPRPLYVDASQARVPFGVGVEERLPGRPLRYETDLPAAARILADVHSAPVGPGLELVAPEHPVADIAAECEAMYATYRAWPQADPAVLRTLDALMAQGRLLAERDRLRRPPARRHVVNTELNSSNFLINEDGPSYLVDWEKPVLGEVEQDLAHFLVPTTTFWKTDTVLTRAQAAAFVDAYLEAVAGRFDTSGVRARLDDYLAVTCLRGLTWCAMAMTEYAGGARAVSNADTFEKIQAYLRRDFLEFIARDYFGM